MISHVYLGYMHQIYMNEMCRCSRLHSCKQYVQEARDHLDQRYDAYTYLEFLSVLVVETHLRKHCQETQEYSTNQQGNRTQKYQDMENIQKIAFLKIDMSPKLFLSPLSYNNSRTSSPPESQHVDIGIGQGEKGKLPNLSSPPTLIFSPCLSEYEY